MMIGIVCFGIAFCFAFALHLGGVAFFLFGATVFFIPVIVCLFDSQASVSVDIGPVEVD